MRSFTGNDDSRWRLWALTGAGLVSCAVYLLIAFRSQSLHVEGSGRHSLLLLLGLFAIQFGIYLVAIWLALGARQDRKLLTLIIVGGVIFRATLLFSNPIEEIDLYRYLWDGAVATQGVSPFRYSPYQVLAASADADLPSDLARLVELRDSSPEMVVILERVHFGELPTVYPPVSQAIFSLAAWTTPSNASLYWRMTWMKAWFVAFDLATLVVVIGLLRFAALPVGWSVAYAWCPLLIKEIANSGHLDALAFFLATLSLYFAVLALYGAQSKPSQRNAALATVFLLSLGVGAKLYPVVLAPLLLLSFRSRFGWRFATGAGAALMLLTSILLWPMLPHRNRAETYETTAVAPEQVAVPAEDMPPLPPLPVSTSPRDPSESLRAFLSEWEMNDFLFLILIENLRPIAQLPPDEVAWFSIVPESWRTRLARLVAFVFSIEPKRIPFFLTRALTSGCFALFAVVLAWRTGRSVSSSAWLAAAFLTMAWFWLLLPTLNPWYWTWALPLLPFARNRAWLALSGLVFLYYFRFWLTYHFAETTVLGTGYTGPLFFDYVVTWLEFGPWFVWLGFSAMIGSPMIRRK